MQENTEGSGPALGYWAYILPTCSLLHLRPLMHSSAQNSFSSLPTCVHYIFQDPALNKSSLNKILPSIVTTKSGVSEHSSQFSHFHMLAQVPGRHLLNGWLNILLFIFYTVSLNKPQGPSEMNYFSWFLILLVLVSTKLGNQQMIDESS